MQEGKRLEQNFMCAVTGPWVTNRILKYHRICGHIKIFNLIDGDVINWINEFDVKR